MPYNIQKVYSDITKRTVSIIESGQDIVIAGNSALRNMSGAMRNFSAILKL